MWFKIIPHVYWGYTTSDRILSIKWKNKNEEIEMVRLVDY
jgi:hypothetical protein